MVRLRRFGIVQTATSIAVMYAIVVFIFFAVLALITLIAGSTARTDQLGGFAAGGIGLLVIGVLAALVYAALGWVFTAIACALYNLVAGWTGGIEMQYLQPAPPPAMPAPAPWTGPVPPAPPAPPAS
jgi:hypothetical protein